MGAISIETKICEICGSSFEPRNGNQKYCTECGKDPEAARTRYELAVRRNKINAGDFVKPMEKDCKNCGKKFITTYESREFCSENCRDEYKVNTAVCPYCKKKLIDKGITTGRGYCSEECRKKDELEGAIARGLYGPCEQCGKKFIHRNEQARFCSQACSIAYRAAHKKPKPAPVKRDLTRKCPACGRVFTITPQQYSKVYCSSECRDRYKATAKQG